MSGYRDEETKTLTITTNYSPVLEKVNEGGYEGLSLEDFRVVFPMHTILTVRIFDIGLFEEEFLKYGD